MIRLTKTTRRAASILLAGAVALLLSLPAGIANARVQSSASGSPRVAMIVLDVSKALTPVQTEAERQAALRYAQALPPGIRVGLVKFSNYWQVMLSPTANRGELATALNASHRSSSTAAGIYGALAAAESAVKAAGGAAGSRLLLFSEGETIPGSTTLTPAFPVDVVTWYHDSDDNMAALRALASASGGRVAAPADAAALASAFPGWRPPAATTHAAHAAHVAHGTRAANVHLSWKLLAMLACIFVSLLLLGLLLSGALHRESAARRLEVQLDRHYTARHVPQAEDGAAAEGKVASAAVSGVTRLLGSNAEQRLALRLDLAGITRKPSEWVVLGCSASLLIAVLLTLLTGSPLVGVPAGALAGWLGMRLIVSARISRRRAAFAEQLPDVLQVVAGSLQSGFSLAQALDAVVREDTQPAAGEFSRALAETRIGGELEDSLDRVADRMDSTDLRWSVMAIRIQRSVGGNLVEVLRNTVDMMRERASLRRHVQALSAEGRLSAYILIALPLLVGGWLFFSRGGYMRPLYTTPLGLAMLIGGALLMVLGTVWMRNVIKVEV
jgi:Flp pilus assembly protein TadB